MIGRVIGLAAGIILLAEGYVLWRPEIIGSVATVDLGPYAPYQSPLAILALVAGVAVLIAAACLRRLDVEGRSTAAIRTATPATRARMARGLW